MSSLLHMLPMGSAWLQWDSDRMGQQTRDTMAQDTTNTAIVGEDGTGKTSLAFQAAVSMATDNKHVTFIRPKVLSHLPLPVHGMPTPEPTALQLVKLWYPEQAEEVVKWCGHIHTQAVLPDVIIIDDFDVFVGQSKGAEHSAARLCASLLDAAAWLRQKSNGHCQLILTTSHRIASLPLVLRQFQFSVVTLAATGQSSVLQKPIRFPSAPQGTREEENEASLCQLTCATPTYNISVRYSLGRQNIMLSSVDSRALDTSTPRQ